MSWLVHAYSWQVQTGEVVAVTQGVGDMAGGCWRRRDREGGVGGVGIRRACQSVSRFQTSEFFWLKSLIRFIMHILALIKVIGVWHSQCQSREPGSTSLPSLPPSLTYTHSVTLSISMCLYAPHPTSPHPNVCLECVNPRLEILEMLMPHGHLQETLTLICTYTSYCKSTPLVKLFNHFKCTLLMQGFV